MLFEEDSANEKVLSLGFLKMAKWTEINYFFLVLDRIVHIEFPFSYFLRKIWKVFEVPLGWCMSDLG